MGGLSSFPKGRQLVNLSRKEPQEFPGALLTKEDQGHPRGRTLCQLISHASWRTESGVLSLTVGLIPAPEAAKAWILGWIVSF